MHRIATLAASHGRLPEDALSQRASGHGGERAGSRLPHAVLGRAEPNPATPRQRGSRRDVVSASLVSRRENVSITVHPLLRPLARRMPCSTTADPGERDAGEPALDHALLEAASQRHGAGER
jgi:hypothetical protein